MKQPHAPEIRELLQAHPAGMTIKEIQAKMEKQVKDSTIRRVLDERMPDVYIDRWIRGPRGQYVSVWIAIEVPPHCPYPTERFKPETRWVNV